MKPVVKIKFARGRHFPVVELQQSKFVQFGFARQFVCQSESGREQIVQQSETARIQIERAATYRALFGRAIFERAVLGNAFNANAFVWRDGGLGLFAALVARLAKVKSTRARFVAVKLVKEARRPA